MKNQQDYFEIHGLVSPAKGQGLSPRLDRKAPPITRKASAPVSKVPSGCSIYAEPSKIKLSPSMAAKATNTFASGKHKVLVRAVLNKEVSERQALVDYQDMLQTVPRGERPDTDCYLYAGQAKKKHERGPERSQPLSRSELALAMARTGARRRALRPTIRVSR